MRGRPGALHLAAPPSSRDPDPVVDRRTRTTAPRPGRSPRRSPRDRAAAPRRGHRRALPRQRPGGGARAALADAGMPYRHARRQRFFDLREVKQALMMRGAAVRQIVGEPLFKTVSDVLRSLGWTQDAPEAAGRRPRPLGVANALMGLAEHAPRRDDAPRVRRRALRRQAAQHEPTMRRSPSPRCTRRRASSGRASTSSALSEGLLPISYAQRPRPRSTRSAACSTSGSPGHGERLTICRGRGRGQGRGRRAPSRFLEELRTRTRVRCRTGRTA